MDVIYMVILDSVHCDKCKGGEYLLKFLMMQQSFPHLNEIAMYCF